MLTDWIFAQASRVAPSALSNETQALINKYAAPQAEEDRHFRELALIVGYSVLIPAALALWALVGWLMSGGYRPSDEFVRIGWGLIVALLVGLGLHLVRYYDALFAPRRGRERRSDHRWPRASTDLDLAVQIAAGVGAAILGAPA